MPKRSSIAHCDPNQLSYYDGYKAPLHFVELHDYRSLDTRDGRSSLSLAKRPKGKWKENPRDLSVAKSLLEDGTNVGLNPPEDILVVDFDRGPCVNEKADPEAVFRDFCDDYGIDLRQFLVVETGGGGFHIYMKVDPKLSWRGKLPGYHKAFDLKSSSGYVVCPGSIHNSGNSYRVRNGSALLSNTGRIPDKLMEHALKSSRIESTFDETTPSGRGETSPESLAAMLSHLKPKDFRDYHGDEEGGTSWLKLMMACHHATAGIGLHEFIEWSTKDPQYADHGPSIEEKWHSLKSDEGGATRLVTVRYLYAMLAKFDAQEAMPRTPTSKVFEVSDLDLNEVPDEPKHTKAITNRLRRWTAGQFAARTDNIQPILDGFLYRGGVNMFVGDPGLGKTATALDLALSIANGDDQWKGRRLFTNGSVVFVAAEGELALINRLKAWSKANGQDLPENLHVVTPDVGSVDLKDEKCRVELVSYIREIKPVLTIIDTLASSAIGLKENDVDSVSPLLDFARVVSRTADGAVVFIHHPPKGDGSVRGSSALVGNTDGVIGLKRVKDSKHGEFELIAHKVRYGAMEPPIRLRLRSLDLGPDPQHSDRRVSGPLVEGFDVEAPDLEDLKIISDCLSKHSENGEIGRADLCKHLAEEFGRSAKTWERRIDALLPQGEFVRAAGLTFLKREKKNNAWRIEKVDFRDRWTIDPEELNPPEKQHAQ
ncbi:MAG: AAA family ATPase [Henriciella sp.]